jgi:hypothetical protein
MSDTDPIDTAVKIITALSHGTATRTMYADSLLQVFIAVEGAERAASAIATVAAGVAMAAAELTNTDAPHLTAQIGEALKHQPPILAAS